MIEKNDQGYWFRKDGDLHGPFQTNAEAWRAFDRIDLEPINKAEERTDWFCTLSSTG